MMGHEEMQQEYEEELEAKVKKLEEELRRIRLSVVPVTVREATTVLGGLLRQGAPHITGSLALAADMHLRKLEDMADELQAAQKEEDGGRQG